MDVCESCGEAIAPGDAVIRVSYGTMYARGLFKTGRNAQHTSDLFCCRETCSGPAIRDWPPEA